MAGVAEHFAKPLRRVPGIVVGILEEGAGEVTALGSLGEHRNPEALCWEIGSITKVFTGILLAEMSLRRELALDDPIGAHLPGDVAARLPAPDRQPNLTDLATHTAGLARLPYSMIRKVGKSDDPYSGLTTDDVYGPLGRKTTRPRRRRMRYSNWGMGLLGHLLANAADMPYGELVAERILTPLGMTATSIGGCGEGSETVQGFRKGKPTPAWSFGALEGAGGLRSTVADMFRFTRAVLNPPDGMLGDALELARRTHHGGRGPMGGVGLGWQVRPNPPKKGPAETVWHDGGTYGTSSFLAIDPLALRAVVAFGNRGPALSSPLNGAAWSLFDSLGS